MKLGKRRRIKFVLDDDEFDYKAASKRFKKYWNSPACEWSCEFCGIMFRAFGNIYGWGALGPCCTKCYLKNCEVRVKKVKKKRKIKFVLD